MTAARLLVSSRDTLYTSEIYCKLHFFLDHRMVRNWLGELRLLVDGRSCVTNCPHIDFSPTPFQLHGYRDIEPKLPIFLLPLLFYYFVPSLSPCTISVPFFFKTVLVFGLVSFQPLHCLVFACPQSSAVIFPYICRKVSYPPYLFVHPDGLAYFTMHVTWVHVSFVLLFWLTYDRFQCFLVVFPFPPI